MPIFLKVLLDLCILILYYLSKLTERNFNIQLDISRESYKVFEFQFGILKHNKS